MKISIARIPSTIDASASTVPICLPIGLAYLKSILSGFTKDITVVDAVGNYPKIRQITAKDKKKYRILGQTAEELSEEIPLNAELILVSVMFSQDWPYARLVLQEIRRKCPKAKIILGGEHITALPEFSMVASSEIDMCVLGEGELTLSEIISAYILSKTLPIDCHGTYVRIVGAGIKKNPRREQILDINSIPWPEWEGFPLENYLSAGHCFGVNLGRSMSILASRGCPFICKFCSNNTMWNSLWRVREPEDVVSEMEFCIGEFKAENFDFYDLTLIIKKEWIIEFANLLIAKRLNITWQLPSGTRSEAIDREVAKLLYKSGCRNLSYAPESGSNEVLKMINKRIQLPKMLESMKNCIKEGLNIKANIMCGFPEERIKHLLESFLFIIKMAWLGVNDMSINQFSPYPGSQFFEILVEQKKINLDEDYFKNLTSYSSMNTAHSYSRYLSDMNILIFKYSGTLSFYAVSFIKHPLRLINTFKNLIKGSETTRLEKTLYSYIKRIKCCFSPIGQG